jgi:CBS domain containing-hemolysin-like protein
MEDIIEEIVGEIQDEYDDEPRISPDRAHGLGAATRRCFWTKWWKKLNLHLPVEEFDSLAGFVFDLFGRIPEKNESIDTEQAIFTCQGNGGSQDSQRRNREKTGITPSRKRTENRDSCSVSYTSTDYFIY